MTERPTLLIVDDDEALATALERGFTQRGYETASASNVATAIDQINQSTFNYAVIDLKIGNESGLTLIEYFNRHSPQTNTLMLTGFSSIATTVEAIKLGATNYLCKPATVSDIIEALGKTEGDSSIEIESQPISVDRLEWEHIQKVLNENQGNISETARQLGMHRRTLQRKLQKKPVKH